MTGNTKNRYFVALPISAQSSALIDQLPKNLSGNWNTLEDLHITIRFLGELLESDIEKIDEALKRVKKAPFFIEIDGLDAFYNKRQNILFAKVMSTKKLVSLCTDITDLLVALGFDFGTRPYIPHVTILRTKENEKRLKMYQDINAKKLKNSWRAEDLLLKTAMKK
jgi:2'-5' RNA ligase